MTDRITPANTMSSADKLAIAGGDEDNPLPLYAPFFLSPGRTMWFTQPDRFHILVAERFDRGDLSRNKERSNGVLLVSSPSGKWLLPQAPLQPGFAHGWFKLPTEIKLRILGYNLTFEEPITNPWPVGKSSQMKYRDLSHHLRMTPEIASLSKEVFYANNKFSIRLLGRVGRVGSGGPSAPCWFGSQASEGPYFEYPHQEKRHLIREIEIELINEKEAWNGLQSKFSNIKLHLPKLQRVIVAIWWTDDGVFVRGPREVTKQLFEHIGAWADLKDLFLGYEVDVRFLFPVGTKNNCLLSLRKRLLIPTFPNSETAFRINSQFRDNQIALENLIRGKIRATSGV